ncbi:hypothetical protein FU656_10220 [Lacticaseibacillus rhamnosus]|nr:hypothetical protein FU656_10220 [Lacticaseibacillus rhamnosus]
MIVYYYYFQKLHARKGASASTDTPLARPLKTVDIRFAIKDRHLLQKISDGLFDCLGLLPPMAPCYNKTRKGASVAADTPLTRPFKTVGIKLTNQKTVIFSKRLATVFFLPLVKKKLI